MSKPLMKLAKETRQVSKNNGWELIDTYHWDDDLNKMPAELALLHCEISEALQEFRNHNFENFLEEMADVQIILLNIVGGLTKDFDSIVAAKIEKNRGRGYKHGGKKV